MRALGSLPSKVSGFADSGGRGACSWVAGGGGGYGGTVSRGSKGTQEVVRQDRVVLQGVHRECQDCQELQGLQEALVLETVEVLQMGRQEDLGSWEVWVHVEGIHLGPKVGVDKVVEDQNCHCHLHSHCWGLQQVVHNWVVKKPLQEEVHS